jgi:hypothetical protein
MNLVTGFLFSAGRFAVHERPDGVGADPPHSPELAVVAHALPDCGDAPNVLNLCVAGEAERYSPRLVHAFQVPSCLRRKPGIRCGNRGVYLTLGERGGRAASLT